MIRSLLGRARRRLTGTPQRTSAPAPDPLQTEQDRVILDAVRTYTMTGAQRVQSLIDAVRYCARRGMPGDFVECGVWRGGSVLAMILTLRGLGVDDRDIWLYDTFEGMTMPGEHDVSPVEQPALATWQASADKNERPWANLFRPDIFNEDMVRRMLLSTGYPEARLHFVKGPVEQTIPASIPERIALLRLDTDWYESTRHELEHLYPRLESAGVLIIDDYGHWEGCRKAVDEYFAGPGVTPLLLQRIDYTGRIAVRT